MLTGARGLERVAVLVVADLIVWEPRSLLDAWGSAVLLGWLGEAVRCYGLRVSVGRVCSYHCAAWYRCIVYRFGSRERALWTSKDIFGVHGPSSIPDVHSNPC